MATKKNTSRFPGKLNNMDVPSLTDIAQSLEDNTQIIRPELNQQEAEVVVKQPTPAPAETKPVAVSEPVQQVAEPEQEEKPVLSPLQQFLADAAENKVSPGGRDYIYIDHNVKNVLATLSLTTKLNGDKWASTTCIVSAILRKWIDENEEELKQILPLSFLK